MYEPLATSAAGNTEGDRIKVKTLVLTTTTAGLLVGSMAGVAAQETPQVSAVTVVTGTEGEGAWSGTTQDVTFIDGSANGRLVATGAHGRAGQGWPAPFSARDAHG